MNDTRTGWLDLYTAQVLWATVVSKSSGFSIQLAPANTDSPCIRPAEGVKIPTALAGALKDISNRAALVSRCTCDVCGKPSSAAFSDSDPVRCQAHQSATPSVSQVNTDEIMTSENPVVEVESMAVANCVDLVLLGPVEYVKDILVTNHDLYVASCTRHELMKCNDPWAPWVAHAVALTDLESPQRAHSRLRYYSGRMGTSNKLWNLEAFLGECWYVSEAVDFLLKHSMLLAASRTCMRYGTRVLDPRLPEILAQADAELARRAIAEVV